MQRCCERLVLAGDHCGLFQVGKASPVSGMVLTIIKETYYIPMENCQGGMCVSLHDCFAVCFGVFGGPVGSRIFDLSFLQLPTGSGLMLAFTPGLSDLLKSKVSFHPPCNHQKNLGFCNKLAFSFWRLSHYQHVKS